MIQESYQSHSYIIQEKIIKGSETNNILQYVSFIESIWTLG